MYMESSAKTNEGVHDLFHKILQMLIDKSAATTASEDQMMPMDVITPAQGV